MFTITTLELIVYQNNSMYNITSKIVTAEIKPWYEINNKQTLWDAF
jgi:hypothetical protein